MPKRAATLPAVSVTDSPDDNYPVDRVRHHSHPQTLHPSLSQCGSEASASPHRRPSLTPAQTARKSFTVEQISLQESKHSGYTTDNTPVSTSRCLQNFTTVIARGVNSSEKLKRDQAYEEYQRSKECYQSHLEKLREWRRAKRERESNPLNFWWRRMIHGNEDRSAPKQSDLVEMVRHFYPLRARIKVYVCDFGEGRFEKHEYTLQDETSYLHDKPPWADVRWIHAPLNVGLAQSSLEELFLKERRKHTDLDKRNEDWPYVQIETLSIRKHEDIKDMQDAYRIIEESEKYTELSGIRELLRSKDEALGGLSDDLKEDIVWRAEHWGIPITHWTLALSDFQRQISNSSADFVDPDYVNHVKVEVENQAFSSCRFYKQAQLIKSTFRTFHGNDGFLLTMCAEGGVDYIDRTLEERLGRPGGPEYQEADGSLISLMFALFSETGSSTWHDRTVDWFLVYLITELVAKPNNIRQGRNAPSIPKAYQMIVQDLKEKRYAAFRRTESVKLVREYLRCIDELSTMSMILNRNKILLENLRNDLQEGEGNTSALSSSELRAESKRSRIDWAYGIVKDNELANKELLEDLQESLTALFQLRSIEQNELAITADSQNKAILIFTGVTIVFLPLSFFTSYFGMNLQGIASTSRTETYFWKICGTSGFVIVLSLVLYTMRHRMARRLHRRLATSSV